MIESCPRLPQDPSALPAPAAPQPGHGKGSGLPSLPAPLPARLSLLYLLTFHRQPFLTVKFISLSMPNFDYCCYFKC